MTHHHASTHEPTTKPGSSVPEHLPRDPVNTPTTDEKALLTALLALDASIRASPSATHLGPKPGDGLVTFVKRIIERDAGVALP